MAALTRELVSRIAAEEAERGGLTLERVLNGNHKGDAFLARKAAWLRILEETGCSFAALARVWGADRVGVWRAVRKHADANERVAA